MKTGDKYDVSGLRKNRGTDYFHKIREEWRPWSCLWKRETGKGTHLRNWGEIGGPTNSLLKEKIGVPVMLKE